MRGICCGRLSFRSSEQHHLSPRYFHSAKRAKEDNADLWTLTLNVGCRIRILEQMLGGIEQCLLRNALFHCTASIVRLVSILLYFEEDRLCIVSFSLSADGRQLIYIMTVERSLSAFGFLPCAPQSPSCGCQGDFVPVFAQVRCGAAAVSGTRTTRPLNCQNHPQSLRPDLLRDTSIMILCMITFMGPRQRLILKLSGWLERHTRSKPLVPRPACPKQKTDDHRVQVYGPRQSTHVSKPAATAT